MRMLLGALALAASLVHGSGHVGQVETLYASDHRIQAFAQDGELLAWFEPDAKQCNTVWVWQLGHAKESLPAQGSKFPNVTCRWQVPADAPVGLALAANSGSPEVLWTLRESASRVISFDYVLGATIKTPLERRFQQVAHARHGAGLWLGGVAGNDGSLLYSVVNVAYHDQVACLSTPKSAHACELDVVDGGIYRIVGRTPPMKIKDAAPAVALAVYGDDVAYLPAATTASADGRPLSSADIPVDIRDIRTGVRVASIVPDGTPLAIGLSDSVLALIGTTPQGLVLSWYAADTGRFLHALTVARTTSPEVSVGTTMIVYRNGRTIRAVDLRTLHVRTLAKAASTPVGLSVAGDRVAWAENVRGRGRIRAITIAP